MFVHRILAPTVSSSKNAAEVIEVVPAPEKSASTFAEYWFTFSSL